MNEEKQNSANIESKTSKLKVVSRIIIKVIIAIIVVTFGIVLYQSNRVIAIEDTIITKEGNSGLYEPLSIKKKIEEKKLSNTNSLLSSQGDIPFGYSRTISFIEEAKAEIAERKQQKLKEEKEELIKNSSKKYVISDNGLNIRNKDWEVIKTLPLNSEVTVLKEKITDDEVYDLIIYNDEYAYISNKYLGLQKKVIQKKVKKIAQGNETVQVSKSTSYSSGKYLGTFSSTAYCNCSKCCGKWAGGATASGTEPTAGRTIAVDPRIIPLGSKVIINGRTYIAEDTGSAIKGNKIDIYFDSHSAALAYGRRNIEVYAA